GEVTLTGVAEGSEERRERMRHGPRNLSQPLVEGAAIRPPPLRLGHAQERPPMSSPSLQLRTLRADDLPDALALQSEAYAPHLRDGAAAFESRLTLGPDTCWVARDGDDLLGYLLAHPWGSMRPPPVDTVLRRDPAEGPAIL